MSHSTSASLGAEVGGVATLLLAAVLGPGVEPGVAPRERGGFELRESHSVHIPVAESSPKLYCSDIV